MAMPTSPKTKKRVRARPVTQRESYVLVVLFSHWLQTEMGMLADGDSLIEAAGASREPRTLWRVAQTWQSMAEHVHSIPTNEQQALLNELKPARRMRRNREAAVYVA